jgi:dihydrodipicolinate synthase/N-acetylneuraminate lyase
MRAIMVRNDLTLARRIYYQQILPLVDVMARNFNPTGTIKAGVCARGVDVGSPRRPGHGVSSEDFKIISRIATAIATAEVSTALELETNRV